MERRRRDFMTANVGAMRKMDRNGRPLVDSGLRKCRGLHHGFFSRHENDDDIAAFFAVPEDRLLAPEQIHSARALAVHEPWGDSRPTADGLVTDRPGLVLAIATADCAPVLLADGNSGVVAALHAGWRGTLAGICEACLAVMERLGAKKKRIRAAIGPCISQNCYEVDASFRDAFCEAGDGDRVESLFRATGHGNHWYFNLPGYIALRMDGAGVSAIGNSEQCTYANEAMFFSHRRGVHRGESEGGRQLSAIMLEES